MNFDELLTKLDACQGARGWAAGKTLANAWETCPRADWMMWLAARLGVDRKALVRAACACVRTVLHLVPAGDDQPRLAIETVEAWTRGEVAAEQVLKAACDAYAAYAAYDAAAYDAATYYAAANYAAANVANAAYYAADANVAYAAYDAACAANDVLREVGESVDLPALVRAHITAAMLEEAANTV